ncbi:hypothetical protein D9M71_479840 [compost metagenome]
MLAGTRECLEDRVISQAVGRFFDLAIKLLEDANEPFELRRQGCRVQLRRTYYPRVLRQRYRFADDFPARLIELRVTSIVLVKELEKSTLARTLEVFKRGPAHQEVTEHHAVMIAKQLQGRWIILFERTDQAVADLYSLINQCPSMFCQAGQNTHRRALRHQLRKPLGIGEQQLKRPLRIGRIILGTAADKGFTVFGQGTRIDGEQAKELVLLQGRHQRAFVELKSNRNRSAVALK